MGSSNSSLCVAPAVLCTALMFSTGVGGRQAGGVVQGPVRDRPPARTGTGVLKGRVLDGLTGAAVPRARVRLMGKAPRSSVLSDSTGTFTFRDLPSGVYSIAVEKSSYLPATYPDASKSLRARAAQPLLVRDGQVVQDLTVMMYRGAAISGRALDAYGDPVESAEIHVTRVGASGGRPLMRGGSRTNDLGEYRVGRLEPGRYLVMAVSQQRFQEEPVANAKPLPQSLPTYYPNTLSLSEAQPVVVERGETVSGIDVMMAEGLPTVVNGVVVGSTGQPLALKTGGFVNARLATRVFSGGGWLSTGGPIRPDGTFRLTLGPGDYVIEAEIHQPEPFRPENQQMGMTRVTVADDAMDIAIVVGRGATASGRVIFEGDTPPPPPSQERSVPLQSTEPGLNCRSGQLEIAADWTFKVEGLFGTCSAPPVAMFGRWVLKAVTVDGHDVTRETMTFQPGQHYDKVQVLVTDRRLELNLRVSDERGQTTRDYVALLFPADKERWSAWNPPVRTFVPQPPEVMEEMQRARAQRAPETLQSGATPRGEALVGLTPGDYFVIALDDIDAESSRDPAVLERLTSSATRVSLAEGASEVALRRVHFADAIR